MDKNKIHELLDPVYYPVRALCLKARYASVLRKLRKAYGKRQISVGFLVSELSKWKGQSLYDYLAKTDDFVPIMLVYPSPHDIKYDGDQLASKVKEKEDYFLNAGMRVKSIWNLDRQKIQSASEIDVDLVFYGQTWDVPPAPLFGDISGRSLTFYFPYYMVNNFNPTLALEMYLHYCIYRYILLNDEQVRIYRPYAKSINYAGEMVGLGHPAIDEFYLNKDYKATKDYVIYAPHFSFKCDRHTGKDLPYYSSTFLEQGKLILEFAKSHPEINWVFKPHPRLRTELTDYDVWKKEDVDAYYAEWEQLGTACYDSHYTALFLESKAMITDCSSFLTEYSCTGKPLIRLIPDYGKTLAPPNPALEKLYDSFYKSYSDKELLELLNMIVLDNKDPMQKLRKELVERANLTGNYAAQNIVDYIRGLLKK